MNEGSSLKVTSLPQTTQTHLGRDPERAHCFCLISIGQAHSIFF